MNKLYVMVGIPGSGKSTWIENNLKDTIHVSRDKVRFILVNENEPYFSKEKEVFNEFIKIIHFYLNKGDDVVADATHISPQSRAKLFNILDIDTSKTQVIAIVMRTPLNICIERNENRKGTRAYVPINAIRRMYKAFKIPNFEEYNGIFDEIDIIDKERVVYKHKKEE